MFIEEYLQDLRRDRYSPRALVVYVRRAFGRARGQLVANPGAVRSVWSVALTFFSAAFVSSAAMALAHERQLGYDFFLWTALGMLPVFALVTLHLDLLRDRDGYHLSALNLPTALTLLRVCLAPGMVLFLARHRYPLALAAFLLAGLSDVLDGWLARTWKQITRLGTLLDPIVDIVFNLALFWGLERARAIPSWVLAAAVLRYAILLVGGACLYLFVGPVRIRPTLFGRLTGIVTTALAAFLMLLHVLRGAWVESLAPLTVIALGALLVATVGYAVALGWFNLRTMTGKLRAPGEVVGDVRWGAR